MITNQNIVEVPASSYHDITDKDMIIYHISDDKEATFHRSTKSMDEYDNGTYGIFKKRISIIKAPGDRSFEMSPGIIIGLF